MAAQIIRTRQINMLLGTQILPWELDDMPADYYDGLVAWIEDVPKAQEWQSKVDESLARLRSRNQQVH